MYYHTPYEILTTFDFLPSAPMPPTLQELGIRSDQEAAELERELGVRFDDFTSEDCDTWILQSVYLNQFSRTRVISFAADEAGVSISTARQWQADNTLGFNQRLEIAVLRYTDVLEVLFLQRAQEPDSLPTLLMTLIRAQMPEKYGPARRSSVPSASNHCNHDHGPQPTTTSQNDQDFLEGIFRDLQELKQFAGLTKPDIMPVEAGPNLSPAGGENTTHNDLSPAGGETQRGGPPTPNAPALTEEPGHDTTTPLASVLAPTDPTSVGAGFKPAPGPSATMEETHEDHAAPAPQNPEPNTQRLNRRQRRQLQHKRAKYPETGAKRKHQNSHRARAPN